MKASEFEERFDSGESILDSLDLLAARRPGHRTKRINIDFPLWMVDRLDLEASRLGVSRQAVIKVWLAERLERLESAASA